jgi:uncharacterized membrane protein
LFDLLFDIAMVVTASSDVTGASLFHVTFATIPVNLLTTKQKSVNNELIITNL